MHGLMLLTYNMVEKPGLTAFAHGAFCARVIAPDYNIPALQLTGEGTDAYKSNMTSWGKGLVSML